MGEGRRAHPEMQGVWGSGLSSPMCMALSLEGPERRGPQTRGALAWPGHQPAPRCAGRGGVGDVSRGPLGAHSGHSWSWL